MFQFEATDDNGEKLAFGSTARDILVWEKTTRGAKFSDFGEGLEMSALYKISHIAAKRLGLFAGDLREWETSYDVFPVEDDDEDPTREDH